MLSGQRILITGVSGVAAWPIAQFLAKQNDVWGIARFAETKVSGDERWRGPAALAPVNKAAVEAAGITTRSIDLASGDFGDLPHNFDYVLHFSWMRANLAQLQQAIRTNVEGAGLLLQHCRSAKAALVASGMGIYSPHADPWHLFTETDPIGRAATAYAPTSPAAKLGVESVARFCARAFDLPVTIARLNTVMGPPGCFTGQHVRAIIAGKPISAPHDPNPHSPIDVDDMKHQMEPLLAAAHKTAFITNLCGDEVITSQEWVEAAARSLGRDAKVVVESFPGAPLGNAADPRRRASLTGPCKVKFKESLDRLVKAVLTENETAEGKTR